MPRAYADPSRRPGGACSVAVHEWPDFVVMRVVSIHTATQVDPRHLHEIAWLDDYQARVYRMARFTASGRDAERGTSSESGDQHVLEQSHVRNPLRDSTRHTSRRRQPSAEDLSSRRAGPLAKPLRIEERELEAGGQN